MGVIEMSNKIERPNFANYESRDGEVFEVDIERYVSDVNEYIDQLEDRIKELEGKLEENKDMLRGILKLNNWFTAHLLSQYAKVPETNKKHIDELYLEFNKRWKGITDDFLSTLNKEQKEQ